MKITIELNDDDLRELHGGLPVAAAGIIVVDEGHIFALVDSRQDGLLVLKARDYAPIEAGLTGNLWTCGGQPVLIRKERHV